MGPSEYIKSLEERGRAAGNISSADQAIKYIEGMTKQLNQIKEVLKTQSIQLTYQKNVVNIPEPTVILPAEAPSVVAIEDMKATNDDLASKRLEQLKAATQPEATQPTPAAQSTPATEPKAAKETKETTKGSKRL